MVRPRRPPCACPQSFTMPVCRIGVHAHLSPRAVQQQHLRFAETLATPLLRCLVDATRMVDTWGMALSCCALARACAAPPSLRCVHRPRDARTSALTPARSAER